MLTYFNIKKAIKYSDEMKYIEENIEHMITSMYSIFIVICSIIADIVLLPIELLVIVINLIKGKKRKNENKIS